MTTATRQTARERLLAAANELFYAEGVQTVGIDRVIERARVAKASLYNTFGSKENLVQAYLETRHQATLQRLLRTVGQHDDPRQRLLAVFDAQAEMFAEPAFHGCAFITASAEAPEGGLIEHAADDYRADIRNLLTGLAGEAGASDPAALGRQLQLLYDGGGLAAQMDRDPDVAASARTAAALLLDAATR
ncbi:TetR/AcrR family transcriptional regulator [Mycobacterium sp.]|uniref:TetR/AcrR family transcriptional regulator n=1 Tax=Mycobacterium sp. TaxID=1785 RepID=UPI003D11D768